jgi:hypothetical protein
MAETSRVNGLIGTLGIKAPVRAATTANIVLSGLQTVDGVALAAGDRVLVKNQATASENGIYYVETGAWTRSPDFDGARDVVTGTRVYATTGVVNGDMEFGVTSTGSILPGTTPISFAARVYATLSALASSLGATLVGFIQAGVGAVARTLQSKLRDTISVKDFGAVGDGVTNDTAAIQSAINYAATIASGSMGFVAGTTTNKPHAKIEFPTATYLIDSLDIPEGVMLDGKNSLFLGNSAVDMFNFNGSFVGYYAGIKAGLKDAFIDGQGVALTGLLDVISNWAEFSNIIVQNCKIGFGLQEVQYSKFSNCYAYDNQVGWLLTARAANQNLTCIDNAFYQCGANGNTKYGVWIQASSHSAFYRFDCSRNLVCNVLLGAELHDYISGFAVTNGGAGYAPSSTLPLIITDATGTEATGYCTTNAGGQITAAYIGECGQNYSATPAVSAAGGAGAVITATISDDTGLGYWDGTTVVTRENNVFHDLKIEMSRNNLPICGYAVWNKGVNRGLVFYNPSFSRQTAGTAVPSEYCKWIRTDVFGTVVYSPIAAELAALIANPSVTGDVSLFKSTVSQGVFILWLSYPDVDVLKTVVDVNNAIVTAGSNANHISFSSGFIENNGMMQNVAGTANLAVRAQVHLDANRRYERYGSGEQRWGDGTAVTDTNLKRASANLLQTDDQFYAVDGLRTKVKAGIPADGDFTVVGSGLIAVDSTNNRLYVRVGATWMYVALI